MQTRIEDQDDATKRVQIRPINSVLNLTLDKLVTSNSKSLLDKLGVSDLLNVPVSSWNHSEEYKIMKSKISNISVTNDHAERGVALVQAYSGRLTKDEDQFNFILQVVEEHRKAYPDAKKQTLGLH